MDKKRILLVEDDDLIRDLYQRQLTQAGFSADGVASGRDGLTMALKNHFDLILLDIMLPDLNGLEVLKQLKQTPNYQKVPIVLLTNLGQDEVVKEGFSLGAEGYLIKLQYTPDQVVQEVKNILGNKHSSLI